MYQIVSAAPPSTQYAPGETIAPTCVPGSSNCTVRPYAVSGVNSDITSLTALTTPLSVSQGGTGTTSLTLNSVLLGNGASGIKTVALGSAYQVFRVPSSGGAPSFGSIDLSQTATVSGALSPLNGGTGITSIVPNSILYSSATNTIAALTSGTNGQVLKMTGGIPIWGTDVTSATAYTAGNGITLLADVFSVNESQLTLGNLGGVLSLAKGGTGTSTVFTAGSIIFAGASGIFSQNNSALSWDNTTSKLSVVGTIAGTHLKGLGSTPSIAASTGAGIGGLTAPIVSVSGTDTAGEITVTTGNGVLATGSTIFTLTFASGYSQTPHVIFTPANGVTALLSGATNVFSTAAASNFTLTSGATGLTLLTTYKWTYMVIE